jgi:hypothetical protein
MKYFKIWNTISPVIKGEISIKIKTEWRSASIDFNHLQLNLSNSKYLKQTLCEMIDYVCTYDKEEQEKIEREAVMIHLGDESFGKIKDV